MVFLYHFSPRETDNVSYSEQMYGEKKPLWFLSCLQKLNLVFIFFKELQRPPTNVTLLISLIASFRISLASSLLLSVISVGKSLRKISISFDKYLVYMVFKMVAVLCGFPGMGGLIAIGSRVHEINKWALVNNFPTALNATKLYIISPPNATKL